MIFVIKVILAMLTLVFTLSRKHTQQHPNVYEISNLKSSNHKSQKKLLTSSFRLPASHFRHPTPQLQLRTFFYKSQITNHKRSNLKKISWTQHPTPNTQHPASSTQPITRISHLLPRTFSTSYLQLRTSYFPIRTFFISHFRHPASNFQLPAPSTQHPAPSTQQAPRTSYLPPHTSFHFDF